MKKYNYQYEFSKNSNEMYNIKNREQKANKMLAVLENYYSNKTKNLSLLDIGCSTGTIVNTIGKKFDNATGIDIDKQAIEYAKRKYDCKNFQFKIGDAMDIKFLDNSFDVVICSHIYEHVPDYNKLISEIYRVLKFDGVCCFAAGNRLKLIEGHYKLPLLSVIPKSLGHMYIRILGKGTFYYENHLTYWELRKLVSKFETIDYTKKIVENPEKYYATNLFKNNSFQQKSAKFLLATAYWLSPTYMWLLRKNKHPNKIKDFN